MEPVTTQLRAQYKRNKNDELPSSFLVPTQAGHTGSQITTPQGFIYI